MRRITGIALGYDNLNDHDDLRRDPLLSGKFAGRWKGCAPLAGKSTLSRLGNAPAGGKPSRYARIDHDASSTRQAMLSPGGDRKVLVFEPSGRLSAAFGRAGRGPGEFYPDPARRPDFGRFLGC